MKTAGKKLTIYYEGKPIATCKDVSGLATPDRDVKPESISRTFTLTFFIDKTKELFTKALFYVARFRN